MMTLYSINGAVTLQSVMRPVAMGLGVSFINYLMCSWKIFMLKEVNGLELLHIELTP